MKITAIDSKDVGGSFWRKLFTDPIEMSSVEGLVENATKRASGRKITELTILDHGLVGGMEFGNDWVDESSIDFLHKASFVKLANIMSRQGAVKLLHCSVGSNSKLLQKFANSVGCTVVATPNYTNPILGVNYGGISLTSSITGETKGILPAPWKSYQEYVRFDPNNR